MKIVIDPEFSAMMPALTDDEDRQLGENLEIDGCRDPLVLWGDILIDGHNRYRLCQLLSIPFKTVRKEFRNREDVVEWIVLNQLGRRNLQLFQRAELWRHLDLPLSKRAADRKAKTHLCGPIPKKQTDSMVGMNSAPPQAESKPSGRTADKIAEVAGISSDTYKKSKVIMDKATPEVKEALRKGETSINREYKKIVNPPPETKPPEPPKPPEVDAVGNALPANLVPVFARKQELNELLQMIQKIGTTFKAWHEAGDALATFSNAGAIKADCSNIYRQIKAAMPYAVCCYCCGTGRGEEHDKPCNACKSQGWLGKLVYEAAPADMKGKR